MRFCFVASADLGKQNINQKTGKCFFFPESARANIFPQGEVGFLGIRREKEILAFFPQQFSFKTEGKHSFLWLCSFSGGLLTTLMIANRLSLLSFPPFLSTPWRVLFHGHPRVQLGRGLFNFAFLRRNKAGGTAVKIEPNCGLHVFGTRQGGHHCDRIISNF